MRRLLAPLLAAAPLVAGAQTAGQVLFDGNATLTVNRTECETDTTGLTWLLADELAAPFVPGTGEIDVYAASADKTDVFPFCHFPDDGAAGVTVGLVAGPFDNPASKLSASATNVALADIASAAGFDCTVSDKAVYVCVVWRNDSLEVKAYAKGTVRVQGAIPDKPVILSPVEPGDGALYVSAEAGAGSGAEAIGFRAEAVGSSCPSTPCDTTTVHTSPLTPFGSKAKISGLTNGVTYAVSAFSEAANGNVSLDAPYTPLDVAEVIPRRVLDFWEEYRDAAQGRDGGGCDAGPGGLLALLGAGGLLRLRRRS